MMKETAAKHVTKQQARVNAAVRDQHDNSALCFVRTSAGGKALQRLHDEDVESESKRRADEPSICLAGVELHTVQQVLNEEAATCVCKRSLRRFKQTNQDIGT
jgi:hypothetical protein